MRRRHRWIAAAVAMTAWLSAGVAIAQEEPDPWREADALYAAGKLAEAGTAYRALFAEEPRGLQSLQTKLRAAECFARAGDSKQALACYDEVIALSDPCTDVATAFAGIQLFWMEQAASGKATIYANQKQFEQAALVCQAIVEAIPKKACYESLLRKELQSVVLMQRMAILAAGYWKQAGKVPESLAMYDAVIAIGQAKRHDPNKQDVIQGLHEQALYEKAQTLVGMGTKADEVLQQLQARFPLSPRLAGAEAIKAGGKANLEQAASLEAAERQSGKAVEQAKAMADGGDVAQSLQQLDRIIADKSNVRVSMLAQVAKGDVLLDAKRYRESREILLPVLDPLRETSPGSMAYSYVRALVLRGLWSQLSAQSRSNEDIADKDIQLLLTLCDDVIATGSASDERALAYIGLVEWRCARLRPRFEEALEVCGHRLEEVQADPEREDYHVATGIFCFYMGVAAQNARRYDEALQYLRNSLELLSPHADPTENPELLNLIPGVSYRIWATLRESGASKDEVDRAAADLLNNYPDSGIAEVVRGAIGQN